MSWEWTKLLKISNLYCKINVNFNRSNDGDIFGRNTDHVHVESLRHALPAECAQLTGQTVEDFNRERMLIADIINTGHLQLNERERNDIILIRNEMIPGEDVYQPVQFNRFRQPTQEELSIMRNAEQYDGGRRKKSKNMRLKKKRSKKY